MGHTSCFHCGLDATSSEITYDKKSFCWNGIYKTATRQMKKHKQYLQLYLITQISKFYYTSGSVTRTF